MFDLRSLKRSFGKAAGQYDANAYLQRQVRTYCTALAQPYLPARSSVLDLGCGTGALFEEASTLGLGWRLSGVDVSEGMVDAASNHGRDVMVAAAEKLPFAAEHFDGIFSSLMLQWSNDPQAVFYEAARTLKSGGHMVLSTFAEGTLRELKLAFTMVDNSPHVSHFYPPDATLACAREAGLSLVLAQQVKMVDYYPDAVMLMRALKDIGATNLNMERKRGLMTSRQFAKLEQAYEKNFATPKGLSVTWQVLYLIVRKD